MTRFAAPTMFGAGDPAEPVAFPTLDALAGHLHLLRKGDRLDIVPAQASLDGEPEFACLSIHAERDGARRPLATVAGPDLDTANPLVAALTRTRPQPKAA